MSQSFAPGTHYFSGTPQEQSFECTRAALGEQARSGQLSGFSGLVAIGSFALMNKDSSRKSEC